MDDTTERDAEIYRRAKWGYPHAVIGKEFGLTRQRVHQIVTAYENRLNEVSTVEISPDWDRQVWVRVRDDASARIAKIDARVKEASA